MTLIAPRLAATMAALSLSLAAAMPAPARAQQQRPDTAALRTRMQTVLDSIRAGGRFPGVVAAVVLADGSAFAAASGMADTAKRQPLTTDHLLLSGSVGKTYAAAVAMQLVAEGKLRLDAKVSEYLGDEPWYARMPNARDVTVRQLMNHTSGLVRYEFDSTFQARLGREPYKTWTPVERVSFVLDRPAPFAAGQGWEYSDTNYIVLGMIIEKLTGRAYYDELRRRILDPLALRRTVPSDRPTIPGLSQAYAGPNNPFGGRDAMIGDDGRFALDPQFEWTGGGIASTTLDLARWGKMLYEGRAFPDSLLPGMLDAVPAKLGPGVRYGLGVIVRDSTPLGRAWGHSGYMPGYLTEMMYFPDLKAAVALQFNTSVGRSIGRNPARLLVEIAGAVLRAQ